MCLVLCICLTCLFHLIPSPLQTAHILPSRLCRCHHLTAAICKLRNLYSFSSSLSLFYPFSYLPRPERSCTALRTMYDPLASFYFFSLTKYTLPHFVHLYLLLTFMILLNLSQPHLQCCRTPSSSLNTTALSASLNIIFLSPPFSPCCILAGRFYVVIYCYSFSESVL